MDDLLREISLPDRRNTDSLKWDALTDTFRREDLLPLWVADMDFKTPLCVRDALHRAVDGGAFGYYRPPASYYESILAWEEERHGTRWEREWIRSTNGVVSGLFHLIRALTEPGDGILLLTPVYYPFFRAIRETGRRDVCVPLREDNGVYSLDREAFETAAAREDVKLFLLCSPHNPVGRVWREEELEFLLSRCRAHGVPVVSDEIHHDLLLPGSRHLSAASLWEGEGKPITFFSPSKTFNLAGMKHSVLMIPSTEQRRRFDAFEARLGAGESSTLDYIAARAAYTGGGPWLDAVLGEIAGNDRAVREALTPFPGVTVSPLEGTYLLWVDLSGIVPEETLRDFMEDRCRVAPDYGRWFYPDRRDPGAHIRLNLAAPRETVLLAASRLADGLRAVMEN